MEKNNMEMLFVKPDSKEWNFMWEQLSLHRLNKGYQQPTLMLNCGEAWEYMGSIREDAQIIHEFRHRNHPKSKKREYIRVAGSKKIKSADIQKV